LPVKRTLRYQGCRRVELRYAWYFGDPVRTPEIDMWAAGAVCALNDHEPA
jgi:hypothetical protein